MRICCVGLVSITYTSVPFYFKRIIFGMYDIWQNLDFEQVGMDLNNVIYAWHLAMYLIKRKLYSTKSTKKNTQPNIVRLQYIYIFHLELIFNCEVALMTLHHCINVFPFQWFPLVVCLPVKSLVHQSTVEESKDLDYQYNIC